MNSKQGINNTNLKQENRGLVLQKIVTGECKTRIEIAKRTGLSKMSVTNIVNEFINNKLVQEQKTEKVEGQGRNPIVLSITDNAPLVMGINIHRSECVVVLTDLCLGIKEMERIPMTAENSKDIFQMIFKLVDSVMENYEWSRILGIGVGGPGPVDLMKGAILNPPDFNGLHDIMITEVLQERYKKPVYMDSQYNCAALAEKYYGVGKNFHDFLFVGITKGIGSGIVLDDRIFHSANGFTSELGHVSIDWNGTQCSCGNRGCLETYAGSNVVREKLVKETGLELDFKEFCKIAETDTAHTIEEIFLRMMEHLACGITSIVNMLNVEAVIIGHDGCYLPEKFLEQLEKLINQRKLSGKYRHVTILKPFYKQNAHVLGCACVVLSKIFEGKESLYDLNV